MSLDFFEKYKQDLYCADEGLLGYFLDKEDFLIFDSKFKRIRTFVKLNRELGDKSRVDDTTEWEIIAPVKDGLGWKSPEYLKDYSSTWAFKKYLLEGKTILINSNGGWNFLVPSDIILTMYSK